MAQLSNFTPLNIKKFPKKAISQNPENRFWKKYEKIYENQCQDAIQQISSGNNKKGLIGYIYKDILEVYDSKEEKTKITVNKLFKSNLMSVNVREDSELIGVGEESGRIQIVDCKKKQPLRKYNTHTKPVHALQFSGRQLLISGSDDKSVQIFDITQDTVIQKFTDASSDYIRSVECLSNTSNILCGSYDGHMTVLDKESGQSVIKFNHGHAIQDIAAFTNGFSLISTGGKEVKLWDIRNNTQPILEAVTNQKDISQVRLVLDNQRIIVSGYDGHLKVLNSNDFSVTHQFKYSQPVMSFDFIHNYSQFAVGMADGHFLVNKKNMQKSEDEEQETDMFKEFFKYAKEDEQKVIKNYKYFHRGMFQQPKDYTVIQGEEKRKKTKAYDRFLKKFEFKNALLCTLATKQNDLIISMLEELVQRNCLRTGLKGLDQEEMTMVIDFIRHRLHDTRYNQVCIEMANLLFDLYWNQIDVFQLQFDTLNKTLEQEVKDQTQLLELSGIIENIVTNSYLE